MTDNITLPGEEWQACTKLPVTVHVRRQRPGEKHISSREGITPIEPDDLIMRGVQGEEYPIGREIFDRTYRLGEHAPSAEPVITDDMRYRAARSLADRSADVCNVDREDNWKVYGNQFLADADVALRAALEGKK